MELNYMLLNCTDDLLNDLITVVDTSGKDNIEICTMGLGYRVFSYYDDKNGNLYNVSVEDAEIIT